MIHHLIQLLKKVDLIIPMNGAHLKFSIGSSSHHMNQMGKC